MRNARTHARTLRRRTFRALYLATIRERAGYRGAPGRATLQVPTARPQNAHTQTHGSLIHIEKKIMYSCDASHPKIPQYHPYHGPGLHLQHFSYVRSNTKLAVHRRLRDAIAPMTPRFVAKQTPQQHDLTKNSSLKQNKTSCSYGATP